MSAKMHIMPEIGLSYLHYSGHITTAEMSASLSACSNHPSFACHFRHIADLSDITSFDNDYFSIMKVQAQAVGMLRGIVYPSCCVFLTPTKVSQTLATIVARSWESTNDPVMLILTEAEQVESSLGLRGISVAQMRAAARPLSMADSESDQH